MKYTRLIGVALTLCTALSISTPSAAGKSCTVVYYTSADPSFCSVPLVTNKANVQPFFRLTQSDLSGNLNGRAMYTLYSATENNKILIRNDLIGTVDVKANLRSSNKNRSLLLTVERLDSAVAAIGYVQGNKCTKPGLNCGNPF